MRQHPNSVMQSGDAKRPNDDDDVVAGHVEHLAWSRYQSFFSAAAADDVFRDCRALMRRNLASDAGT